MLNLYRNTILLVQILRRMLPRFTKVFDCIMSVWILAIAQPCLAQGQGSWGNPYGGILLAIVLVIALVVVVIPVGLIAYFILRVAPQDAAIVVKDREAALNLVAKALMQFQKGEYVALPCPSCKSSLQLINRAPAQVAVSCACGICNGIYTVQSRAG